jgi:AP2-associated kinase
MHQLIRYMLEPDAEKRPNIFQVGEITFRMVNRANPIQNLYKQPVPSIENLITPPFESDMKKSTALNTPKASVKVSMIPAAGPAPLLAKETSVTPRQRPKACQLNPVNNQFIIGLPPSPSPRNVLSSPIDAQNFKTPLPPKTPENFNAQFEVDFTNIEQQTTPVPQPPAAIQQQPQSLPQQPQQQPFKTSNEFDNLFKSTFPDPFEHDEEIVQIQTNYVDPQQQQQIKNEQLFDSVADQQHMTASKYNQHRRYMSDTSGFRRYSFTLFKFFFY